MAEQDLTIQGNEINGYGVVQKVEGEWVFITRRFSTYDEAVTALANVE